MCVFVVTRVFEHSKTMINCLHLIQQKYNIMHKFRKECSKYIEESNGRSIATLK